MTSDPTPAIPNALKERDPELVQELRAFRVRLENMLHAKLDDLLDATGRDRGHFLPREELLAIAQATRVLTNDTWTEEDLDLFDASWRDAMRSEWFGDEFESSKHRIQNAVDAARTKLLEKPAISQGTLW